MDNTEKRQIEALRRFLRRYAFPIGAVVVLTLAVLIGQNVYQQSQVTDRIQATVLYSQFQNANVIFTQKVRSGNISVGAEEDFLANMGVFASRLRSEYKNTGYAAYASLKMGGEYALRGDTKNAEAQFRWVIANSASDAATDMAKVLLARILLEKGEPQQALLLLTDIAQETDFVAELQGDIFRIQQDKEKATAAYNRAIELGANRDFMNYKLSLLEQE